MLKDLLYATVGASVLVREKVQDELKILEDKGKIKKSDAKEFLKSIEKKGKAENKRVEKHIKKMIKETIDELGIATKKDLEKLKEELKK